MVFFCFLDLVGRRRQASRASAPGWRFRLLQPLARHRPDCGWPSEKTEVIAATLFRDLAEAPEDCFTTKDYRLRGTRPDDLNLNCRGHRRHTTSIDLQTFAIGQFALDVLNSCSLISKLMASEEPERCRQWPVLVTVPDCDIVPWSSTSAAMLPTAEALAGAHDQPGELHRTTPGTVVLRFQSDCSEQDHALLMPIPCSIFFGFIHRRGLAKARIVICRNDVMHNA